MPLPIVVMACAMFSVQGGLLWQVRGVTHT